MLGELRRDHKGKKIVTAANFEKNWRATYTTTFNEKHSELAGLMTGRQSNVIAIDCDDQVTYNIFKSLDPDYKFHFVSVGKPSGGATIMYKYDAEVPTYSISEKLKLDVFSDEGFIFLPTENNHTKQPWKFTTPPELKTMPQEIKSLLVVMSKKNKDTKAVETKSEVRTRLAPLVESFVKEGKYMPSLFSIITPKSFRTYPSYVAKGHLHPNDIAVGSGSDYLSKVSCILGADISISKELYYNALGAINGLWKEPMDDDKLQKTIIAPMIEQRTTIEGKVVWKYDEHWNKHGLILTALNEDSLESFYDDVKGLYYLVNYTREYVKVYTDKRPCISTIKTLVGRGMTELEYDSTKKLIRTVLNPAEDFGHTSNKDEFNLFEPSPGLAIINDPEKYRLQYKTPTATIEYFKSFIPDEQMRNYVLSFIKTKFMTFDYSPVVLYFIGAHGSGKDTFVKMLSRIINVSHIAKPDAKVFLEQYNSWMMDKYFIQLDEYGNKLNRLADKQEALGILKSISGAEDMQIRPMRQEAFNHKHGITFIMTANLNPLPVETGDRRMALINTPNKLDQEEWVAKFGGIRAVIDKIAEEHLDFCYYLGTEIEQLNPNDYVIAPYTKDKEKLIVNSMPAWQRIIYSINNSEFYELANLAAEYQINEFTRGWLNARLDRDKLVELYLAITDGRGSANQMIQAMRDAGFNSSHSTSKGRNVHYYSLGGLKAARQRIENEIQFNNIEEDASCDTQQDLNI